MPETTPNRPIAIWLFLTAFMVFAMAVIGAVTRLTESGLSIVEWQPLIGAIPPLNDAEWQRVFDLYKESPEYIKKNSWMELADFKQIFFWEWLHRFWGRLIGLVFALPLLWFWVRKKIPAGYGLKFFGVFLLGAAQGVMGWIMVKSGLVDRPSVSHFRLAAHLFLAFAVYSCLLWLAFDFCKHKAESASFCLRRHGWVSFGFITLTLIWGAFVAGLDGGLVYNTWPTMDGAWVPRELDGLAATVGDPVGVQFIHRWLAPLTGLVVLSFWWRCCRGGYNWPAVHLMGAMVLVQIALGIITLLTQVHIHVAATHQAGAFILAGLMIYNLHRLRVVK